MCLNGVDIDDLLLPGSFGSQFGNPLYTWSHKWSADSEHTWQRGKGLGGSSGINFLSWTMPPAVDVDDIERLGNPGWNWKNFTKYAHRATTFHEPSEELTSHAGLGVSGWEMGKDGPIPLAFPRKIDEGELQVRETWTKLISPARQPMNGDPHGYFFCANTVDPKLHTRAYSTTAYYLPNKHRKNLSVLVSAPCRRVMTKVAENGELVATGVEFDRDGQIHRVTANKEVIISAGTIQSPHMLEQSGIGHRTVLEKAGIPVKVDLPGVGENLQEHDLIAFCWELKDDVKWDTTDLLRDPVIRAEQLELHPRAAELYKSMEETVAKVDPTTTPPGLVEQYKLMLEKYKKGSRAPGIEYISIPGFVVPAPHPPEPGKRYCSISFVVNHCWSRGAVHSVSQDPKVAPEIDPRYFDQEIDLEIMLEGIKFVRDTYTKTAPFKDMYVRELNPGPHVQTDDQLRDWLRACTQTVWHTAGTCSMMPQDKNGVVGPDLKVYGTRNLRVVDLSILPLHIATHPQSYVYAMAEQAADIIKGKFEP